MANEISQIQGIDNTFVNWSIKIKSTLISLEDTLIFVVNLHCSANLYKHFAFSWTLFTLNTSSLQGLRK